MAKPTAKDLAKSLYLLTGGELRFISGKWFRQGKEIREIRAYMAKCVAGITSPSLCDDTMEMYKLLYGESGEWPESSIIQRARAATGALQPLPFPLTKEQLMIIRVLIEGDEEVLFITTGVGGSGKSTYLNIIRQIFDNDCAACPLDELTGYQTAEAVKHRLIASDELSGEDLDSRTLKTIISKQEIQVNPKFERPYQVRCQSRLFFCCNSAPRIDLGDTGMLRRIIYYKMDKKIENPDLALNRKRWSDDDLITIVRHALSTDISRWREAFESDTHEYLLKNNSVYIEKNASDYDEYRTLCRNDHLKDYSRPRWEAIRELMHQWGVAKLPLSMAPEISIEEAIALDEAMRAGKENNNVQSD